MRTKGEPGARNLCALLAVALLAALVLALPGCKYSDVLTQHTEDPTLGSIDESAEPIYESNPDAEERPDLADVTVNNSDDENAQVAKLPHYDPSAPDNGPTKKLVKNVETPHDEEAAEGQIEGVPDRMGQGEGDNGGESSFGDGSDDGESEGDGEELTSDEVEEEGDRSEESSGGGETVVVDPDGTTDDAAKGTVAAVGEYATIAQMLGGAGALAAADEAWLAARSADGAFEGELDRVRAAFAGDGSEEGSCDVEALVEEVQPSVVLWDSAANEPALSAAERSKLEAAGITVQPVPHLGGQVTEDYDVKTAIAEVASVLEGASGLEYDPIDVLGKYNDFHDEALKACYDANGGYSYKVTDSQYAYLYQNTPLSGLDNAITTRVATVFVDAMKDFGSKAVVSQTASASTGMIRLAHDGLTLDISDGVGLSASTSTSGYMLIDYYLQLAGVMNNAYDTAQPESQGRSYILMPGSTASFGTSGNFASRLTGSAFFYNAGDGTVAANWHALGDSDFACVLAATPEIAEAIANSASKTDGLYHMETPYRVVVVPSGIAGEWSEGHLDSFLLAPWAFRIQDEASLDAAASYVQGFYSTFLRCGGWEGAIGNWDSVYETQ